MDQLIPIRRLLLRAISKKSKQNHCHQRPELLTPGVVCVFVQFLFDCYGYCTFDNKLIVL